MTASDHGSGAKREQVSQLEAAVSDLQEQLRGLRAEFETFRSQFG